MKIRRDCYLEYSLYKKWLKEISIKNLFENRAILNLIDIYQFICKYF